MTLSEAQNLKEGDLIECLYQGRVWIRALFEKLDGDKILKGNGDLAGLDECRLIPIEPKHFISYGFKPSPGNGYQGSASEFSFNDVVFIGEFPRMYLQNKSVKNGVWSMGQKFTYVHELMRYCKENNIEGKGWK